MIFLYLLKHQIIKAVRAPGFYKNVIANIFVGLAVLYFFVMFLLLGFFLRDILLEADLPYEPTDMLLGSYLYVVVVGIATRFMMQSLNTINLPPYQILPIKRNTLVNYLLLKPLFNPVNYFLLVPIVPFTIRSLTAGDITALQGLSLIIIAIMIVWFNIFVAVLLKRRYGSSLWGILTVICLIAIVGVLEIYGVVSFFDFSVTVFGFLVYNPLGILVMALCVLCAYGLNRRFFAKYYYAERFDRKSNSSKTKAADFSFMERFGQIGELIELNLKLILRHKRTKSLLTVGCLFLAYGLLFYPNKHYADSYGLLFFAAVFVVGSFTMLLGQWVILWNGSHFDYLMTKPIDTRTYICANYYMLIGFSMISFVLSTPYFLFGTNIIILHLSALLYNMGVNTAFFMLVAPFIAKRLDLSKGSAMNYQGTTYKNFLFVMPILFVPWGFVALCSSLFTWQIGVGILGALGLIGLLLHRQVIRVIERVFVQRKYILCDSFRQQAS